MAGERNYTEKEAAKILRIASEIQRRESDPESATDGVSLDELARIGEEVGLDAKAVRLAAERIEDSEDEVQTRLIGAPPTYEVERIIDGPLTDEVWDQIVGELNSSYAQSSTGVSTGRTRTWSFKQDTSSTHFTAIQTGKKTRLTLKRDIDDGLSVAMVPTIALMVLGMFGPFGIDSLRPWGSLLIGILLAASLGLAFRATVKSWYRKERRRTARIMDKVVLAAQEIEVEEPANSVRSQVGSAAERLEEESEAAQQKLEST